MYRATEGDLEEVKDIFGDGGRASQHGSHFTSQDSLELIEQQGVVDCMSGLCRSLKIVELFLDAPFDQRSLRSRELLNPVLHQVIKSVL